MAIVGWESPSAWADAFTSASLTGGTVVNGYGLQSSVIIANGTALDLYCDLSVRLGSITPTAGAHLAFYLLPLLDDGSTYADGTSSSTATSQPSPTHFVGALALRPVSSAQNGMVRGITIPPGSFRFYMINRAGVALATGTSVNFVKYRTYGEQVV